jgi:DNA-binding transcriptional LysR family regulator
MNFKTLDLNLLVVFDALQRTHSTTVAGEQIGVTQSGISNALRRLREAFGDELFVRTDRGMTPTPLAQSLGGPIHAALQQIRQTVENRGSFDARTSSRHFCLALSDIGQLWALPSLLSYLREAAPNITLETVPLLRHGMADAMANGEIDLALGVCKPLGAGFVRQRLKGLRFVAVARRGHPTIQGSLSVEQFLQASFIEYQPTGGSYAHFAKYADELFTEHRMQRRIAVKLAHLPGIDRMVAGSDSIAVVSEALARLYVADAELQVFELPFAVPALLVTQQWHERINKDPAHAWMREAVARLAGPNADDPTTNVDWCHDNLPLSTPTTTMPFHAVVSPSGSDIGRGAHVAMQPEALLHG